MKIWIKRVALGLGALLLALLLLVLAWVASNWRDAEPQPWPEALTPHATNGTRRSGAGIGRRRPRAPRGSRSGP